MLLISSIVVQFLLSLIVNCTQTSSGIAADCIGITSRSKNKTAKLTKVAFYTRLLDLHRSNPFGPGISVDLDESRIPDQW